MGVKKSVKQTQTSQKKFIAPPNMHYNYKYTEAEALNIEAEVLNIEAEVLNLEAEVLNIEAEVLNIHFLSEL